MTTPLDSNHRQDDAQANQAEFDADTYILYRAFDRAGAIWRSRASADLRHIDESLRASITQLQAHDDEYNHASPRQFVNARSDTATKNAKIERSENRTVIVTERSRSRISGWRLWVSAGVTVALVIAFLATFAVVANQRGHGDTSITVAPTPTMPPTLTMLPDLDSNAVFSANDQPAIAPSDPNVVYETFAQAMQTHKPATMRMTTDGGKTWHSMPTPVQADHIGYLGIGVSPLNASTIFLDLDDTDAAECPANTFDGWSCEVQYVSVDAGQDWAPLGLPLANGQSGGISTTVNAGLIGWGSSVHVQGQRLYAGFWCTNCSRLVTSTDGGRNWVFADNGLITAGAQSVCDYTANAWDTTLYAITSTSDCAYVNHTVSLTLWRSPDAGTTWFKISQLSSPDEWGLLTTQNRVTGATMLYMWTPELAQISHDKMGNPYPTYTASPTDVKVSVDGGVSWQSAPTTGIPDDQEANFYLRVMGTLSDGSVIIDAIPTADADTWIMYPSDLYSWKPGDAGWRHIASVPIEIDGLTVVPSPKGAGDTIYTVLDSRGLYSPIKIQLGW
jgi:hypothetical protein